MIRNRFARNSCAAALLLPLLACELKKSETPLSPSVAARRYRHSGQFGDGHLCWIWNCDPGLVEGLFYALQHVPAQVQPVGGGAPGPGADVHA